MTFFSSDSVSVVIPTIGRASLQAAVLSAAEQTAPPREIVVVFDMPEVPAWEPPRCDVEVRSIATGGGRRANGARNAGVAVARGNLIALLDDDDVWQEDKLARQLAHIFHIRPTDDRWLSATALLLTGEVDTGRWPRVPITDGASVAQYLFGGTWRTRSPALQPSTWIAPRTLFVDNPFVEEVGLHDDWDWLVRVQHRTAMRVFAMDESLTTYRVGGGDSIVSSARWEDSAAWILDPTLPISSRLRSDFILSQAHRVALRTRGRVEAFRVIRKSLAVGRPSAAALVRAGLRTIASRHQRVRRLVEEQIRSGT